MEQELPAIGSLESKCPSCSHPLDLPPERKTRCPYCGKAIYLRTRPADRKRVLLTEDQAELVKEQWAMIDGVHAEYVFHHKRVRNTKARLASRLGEAPTAEQVRLELLIEDGEIHARRHQWGMFSAVRREMAEIVRRTSGSSRALPEYLEVCYLQLNGPNNLAIHIDRLTGTPMVDSRLPPWDPKHGQVTPLALARTRQLIEETRLERKAIREMFLDAASNLRASLSLPLSANRAWRRLDKCLFREAE